MPLDIEKALAILSLAGQNNPFSGRPFGANQGIGLTGLDPKFINDPRFDYIQKLVQNRPTKDNPDPWLVLLGNASRDDFDSAPIGAKSTLAVDEPWQKLAAEMEGKSIGPSPWFTQNTKELQKLFGSKKITRQMVEAMRLRILQNRQRIEDRY